MGDAVQEYQKRRSEIDWDFRPFTSAWVLFFCLTAWPFKPSLLRGFIAGLRANADAINHLNKEWRAGRVPPERFYSND